jgi:putative endonuclease
MKGWMYILECADKSYYTGSTNNLELRLEQHQTGNGANHTKKRLPVKLVIMKNSQESRMPFTAKNKFRAGVEKRKKH